MAIVPCYLNTIQVRVNLNVQNNYQSNFAVIISGSKYGDLVYKFLIEVSVLYILHLGTNFTAQTCYTVTPDQVSTTFLLRYLKRA